MAELSRQSRPPHGGYPTPTYGEASARRRLTSYRLFGHTGAHVPESATSEMFWAGHGRRCHDWRPEDVEAVLHA